MTATYVERRKTCWVYSPGGHLTELVRATEGITFTDLYHVTFRSGRAPQAPDQRVHHVCHPRRAILRTCWNAVQSAWILLHERPKLIISTGADVTVPTLVLGRLLGALVVFVETGGTLHPSLAGRLVYPFCHLFVVPWPQKLNAFPKAVLATGPLL
jgi:UDP-N-acetylglucosamine:LPS N-acetylglucosamine transferase